MNSRGWRLFARLILVGVLMLPATIPSAFAGDSQLEPLVENALVEGEIGFEAAELVVDPLIGTDTPVGGSEPPGVEQEVVEPAPEATVDIVDPQPARAPATLALLESVDLMMPLAIPDPGYYTVGVDAVPLTVYVNDASTNNHTMPVVLWSNGDTLYVAVKSTHALQWMTLQGVINTGMDEYDPWVSIYIDGVKYDPTGLSGNTSSSHWTVFSGPIASLDLSQPLTYTYFIKGIGGGHDVSGTFDVEPPVVSVGLSKVWAGGLMPEVAVNLMRKVGTGAGVLVSTHTLSATSPSATIADLPYTDSAGRIYTYYVVEPNPPSGYAFTYTATFDAATMAWTIVGTNSFTPPLIDIVGSKVWSGGPATRPAVELQLYRDGVSYLDSKWTTEHVFTVTWSDVPATDSDGNPYTYSVEEVSVPTNYTMTKDNPLTVRNTWSYVPPLMDLTVEKVWGEWDADTETFINVGSTPPPTLDVQLTRNGVAVDGEIKTITSSLIDTDTVEWGGSVTWSDLPETGPLGIPILWSVVKINPPADYGAFVSRSGNTITYQNVYHSPTTRVRVLKVWEGGPVDPNDPPPVTVVLERSLANAPGVWDSVESTPAIQLVPPAPGVPAIWGYEFVTDRTDTNGEAYIFRGNEVPFTDEAPYTNYVMSRSAIDPLTVINTFVSPKVNITGTKMWVNGPVGERQVELQLYREGEPFGDPVLVTEGIGAEASYTWNVDQYDSDGIELHYHVDEVATPVNYIRSNPDDLTVVNTYTPPLIDVVGRKFWDGGQGMNFPVTIQLMADGVASGDPVTLAPRQATYTWEGLPATTLDGTEIAYAITEPNPPANYEAVQVDDLTIRNVYTPPLRDFTGYKVWEGGSAVMADVELQLYEGATAIGDPVVLAAGVLSHTWTDLPATDHNGLPLTYWIDEVEAPPGFTKSVSLDGSTVTNTYASDKIDVTGRKLWSGGPDPKPDIQLQLYRNDVAFGDPVTIAGGDLGYTWVGLDRTDGEGEVYTYTVDEVDVPENYVKEIGGGGLAVLNTYVSPKTGVTGTKVWVGGKAPRPTIQLQLYRDGLAIGDPVSLADGTTTYTWASLDVNDALGHPYTYTVQEVAVPEGYTSVADGLRVTNTAKPVTVKVPVKASPKTGDIASGALGALALGALGVLGIGGSNRSKRRRER